MISKNTCTRMSSVLSMRVSHATLLRTKLLPMSTVISVFALLPSPPVLAQAVIDWGQVVTVPGSQASPWNVGGILTVGDTGNGTLEIYDNGEVTGTAINIGNEIGSTGTVSVSGIGAILEDDGTGSLGFNVGVRGTGFLTITNGGQVYSLFNGYVAAQPGSTGTAIVNGTGSVWNSTGLAVGYLGNGFLTISDGGKVSSMSGDLGMRDGSSGMVIVTGSTSEWNIADYLYVGLYGDASLTIEDGGKVTARQSVIAFDSNTTGSAIVTGSGSVWENSIYLVVGSGGTGSLIVADGGTVFSAQGQIGSRFSGTALVSGSGSQWINNYLYIGVSGTGSLVVADGGKVTSITTNLGYYTGSTGSITIGSSSGQTPVAPGILDTLAVNFIQDSGSVVFNHTATDYVFDATINNGADNVAGSDRGLVGNGLVEAIAGRSILNADHGDFIGTLQASGNGILQINGDMSGGAANILAGGTLEGNGTVGSIVNAGILAPGAFIGTLTVTGDYIGNNGVLELETALGDDSSTTDKLIVGGDASGTTYVSVNNVGGQGGQTVEGIKIVDVAGTSSVNAFVQSGRIVAGAYEYSLIQGSAQGNDTESWYLTSQYIPTPTPDPGVYVLRPEDGAYLANLAAANTLFNLRLHDRLGEPQFTERFGDQDRVSSMWVRYQYGQSKFKDNSGQLSSESDRNLLQVGGDIAEWGTTGGYRFHAGWMGGYGRVRSDSTAALSGYRASGEVKGYSAGIYGTWYGQREDLSGPYVDMWAMWNRLKGEVKGEGLPRERNDLEGVNASLEAGYAFKAGRIGQDYEIWLQPQAQVIWMGVGDDTHVEANGTRVRSNRDNVQTRLGVRSQVSNTGLGLLEEKPLVQAYLELNWLHNSKRFGVWIDDTEIRQAGTREMGEVRLGLEASLNRKASLWGNVGYQWGSHGYRDTTALVGYKYSF